MYTTEEQKEEIWKILPTFYLQFDDVVLDISPEIYFIPDGNGDYVLLFQNSTSATDTDWLIGQNLLRGRRTVFDNDNGRIGFAVFNQTQGEENITGEGSLDGLTQLTLSGLAIGVLTLLIRKIDARKNH